LANKDWAPFQLKENVFWREGMTPEEFDEEREYLYRYHWEDFMQGDYLPLWVQRTGGEEAQKWKDRFQIKKS